MSTTARLLVIAVTRLSDGVCVACVDEQNRWVRPTRQKRREWRQLEVADLYDARGRLVVAAGNVVDWELARPAPHGVHSEDVYVGRSRPRFVALLAARELLARCAAICQRDLRAFLSSSDRSLTLIRPERIRCFEFNDASRFAAPTAAGLRGGAPGAGSLGGTAPPRKGGLICRIHFVHEGIVDDYGVTDLRWRALGRRLLAERGRRQLSCGLEAMQQMLSVRLEYLAVGRGQPWEEKKHPLAGVHWPFFIAVVTDPPLAEPIDFSTA